jgi:gluconokinase
LEGIAISLEEVWEALVSHGLPDLPVLLTGGITQSPVWAQIVCDVLGVPMAAVEAGDASAVGAAILGHFALGNIASVDQISAQIKTEASWAPDPSNHAIYHKLQQKSRILYQTSKQLSES